MTQRLAQLCSCLLTSKTYLQRILALEVELPLTRFCTLYNSLACRLALQGQLHSHILISSVEVCTEAYTTHVR